MHFELFKQYFAQFVELLEITHQKIKQATLIFHAAKTRMFDYFSGNTTTSRSTADTPIVRRAAKKSNELLNWTVDFSYSPIVWGPFYSHQFIFQKFRALFQSIDIEINFQEHFKNVQKVFKEAQRLRGTFQKLCVQFLNFGNLPIKAPLKLTKLSKNSLQGVQKSQGTF